MFLPGSLGNVLPRAALPKVEESLWYPGIDPPSLAYTPDSTDVGINLGVQFAATVSGDILGICFYRFSDLAPSNGTVALWNADERIEPRELVASKTFTGISGTGWKRIDFDAPVPITTAKSYFASVWIPEDLDGNIHFGSTAYFFGEAPIYSENGLLWAWPNIGQPYLPHGIYKRNGWYKYGAFHVPDDQFVAANYWVDVVLRASPLPAPPDPPMVLKWEIPDGYPTFDNTGIPPGTVLTPVVGATVVTTADGQIIENLDINGGGISVRHHNCIVRKCKIYFRGGVGIGIFAGIWGTVIEDCDVNSGFRANGPAQGITGCPLSIRRCNLYRGENGFQSFGHYDDGSVQQVFEDNFVHHLRSSPGVPHYDCFQFNGGSGNVLIRHNTFHNENTDTSAVLIQNLNGPIDGIRIEDNLLCGGGYSSYCVGMVDDPSSSSLIVQYYNNQLRIGANGYINDTAADPEMAGNRFMDHGEIYDAMPPDGFTEGQMVRERFFGMPNGAGIIPGSIVSDAVSGLTLGVSFTMEQDSSLVGVNIPKIRTAGQTITYKVGVWRFTGADRNAGTELLYQETINFTSGVREGWEYLAFAATVPVDAGENVLLGVWHTPGADGRIWYTARSGFFDSNVDSQFARGKAFNGSGVPLNGFTGGNGLYNYGSDIAPPLNQGGSRPSYNIDPIFEAPWASSDSISINPAGQQVAANVGQATVAAGNSISVIPANQRVTVSVGRPTVTAVITGSIPLTYGDARFAGNAASGAVVMSSGTLLRKSITETGVGDVSVLALENIIIDTCRLDSREGVRVSGNGVDIRNCYIRAEGEGDDHADSIQAYSPGQTGSHIQVRNTGVVMGTVAVNAGLFVADNWSGTVTCNNVMFQGGLYGYRVHADPGCTVNVYMKDIFFVGPFTYGALLIEPVGSGVLNITHWENVRNATIVGGVLVPGSLIPEP